MDKLHIMDLQYLALVLVEIIYLEVINQLMEEHGLIGMLS